MENESSRMSWVLQTLEKIPKGSTILDAGAGEQKFKIYCQHLNYVSQDFAQYDPGEVGIGLQMDKWDYTGLDIISDIVDIPRPDASFDSIMCIEVIEHIPDPAKVFPEFSRLLKRGGLLILTAPFCSLTHFAPYHYSTGFSRYYYEKHLNDHGFEIVELKESGNYFEYLAQEVHRLPEISQKYTDHKLTTFEKFINKYFLKILQKLVADDRGSKELLCFGIFVFAKKK